MLLACLGTLAAVAAIAIAENFVPSAVLFLSEGEYEVLAIALYACAVLAYIGVGRTKGSRTVSGGNSAR